MESGQAFPSYTDIMRNSNYNIAHHAVFRNIGGYMRTAIYMRVSTSKQAQEGDSIPAQREALLRYVDEHKMTLVGEYVDGGASGTKADRDELQNLLEDVKADKIDHIAFVKLDRWFRSVRHYTATQEILDAHHVTWTAVWEPIYDTSTPSGRLIVNQMMSIAQFEAENSALRIRQVFDYKASIGEVTSGKIPFGYSIKDKRLVPNENADIIRKVFEFYDQNGSLHKTRNYAASIGYDRDMKPLKSALMNRKYIGEYRGKTAYCVPIISKELFDSVQQKLKMNIKSTSKVTYIFAGLVHCGTCGRRMSGCTHRNQNHPNWSAFSYYHCPGVYKRWKADCDNNRNVGEEKIESFLLENIKPYVRQYKARLSSDQEFPQDNSRKISELKSKLSRLTDLYVESLITMDDYTKRKAEYEKEITVLQQQEREKPAALDWVLEFDFDGIYKTFSREEKQLFWRRLVDKIIIYDDWTIQPIYFE